MTTDKYIEVLLLIERGYSSRKKPITEELKAIFLGELCGVVKVACRDPEIRGCDDFVPILREREMIMRKFDL